MARRKKKVKPGLLIDSDEQLELMDKSMEQQVIEGGEVECLGMKFPNDDERKKYFLEILREKLKDPEFRKIEGFPIGEDEDILALSDPPYYTACPNPFIEDFIKQYGKPYNTNNDNYNRKPFAADVSEGRGDPIYNLHAYHTKVPHKAIMRYLLHYTEPGDLVFDGFCGTGMTGVAAHLCGDRKTIESLGYKIDDDEIYETITNEKGKDELKPFSKLGIRRSILNDLSPAATFISYNYNTPVNVRKYEKEAKRIFKEVKKECEWMYETLHTDGKSKGNIKYIVWSDVFVCKECAGEIVYWDVAVDKDAGDIRIEFQCPHCNSSLTRRSIQRAWVSLYDNIINKHIRQVKQKPVLLKYTVNGKSYEKSPDKKDLELIRGIDLKDLPHWFPTSEIPKGDKTGEPLRMGITHIHHLYTKRNLITLATLNNSLPPRIKFLFTGLLTRSSKQARFLAKNYFYGGGGWVGTSLSGTLFIPSFSIEVSPLLTFANRLRNIISICKSRNTIINTSSSTCLAVKSSSVDYIFTDPPFGSNLMYSELNIVMEAWLKVFTHNDLEAVENKVQEKMLIDYQHLMSLCFREYYRILKAGRWMTVEFHNSKNSVWNSIQESLQSSGFIIADVRTLDKKQGSFNQVTQSGSVKQDIIISCYKPNDGLVEKFKLHAGSEDGVWNFIRTHLKQLPIFVSKDGEMEVIAERQNYLLFDRMVAFHVQRGVSVPISAGDFYKGLAKRFPERDGMYFLSEQVVEYDKKRMSVNKVLQLQLFVNDEASAIQWLKQQLTSKPQTFQDIHPVFMRELGGWQKHEKPLELSDLLAENFLRYDGKEDVPSQIHSYLSSNFKELRNLQKDDPKLKAKAKDRWYVPDPNKAGDLEKLRERSLLKEFEEYKESTQRKLKVFRLEAIRAGFKKAWQEKDYKTIIEIAKKIPDNVLQEDSKLLMWYDQALTRSGEE